MHEARRQARMIAASLIDNYRDVGQPYESEAAACGWSGAEADRVDRALRDLQAFLEGAPSRKRRRPAPPAGTVALPLE